ncbi:MAG: ferrous iron transport protein A [Gemmatimonadaceae bacterium]|nr:ferrous iron transport protein A [Gemmatimonadaceae bacterium]
MIRQAHRLGSSRPLDQLTAGERGIITSVDCPPPVARRLMELGLTPGTEVEMIRRAPLGDPLEIAIRGIHLSLRRSEARHIDVRAS